MPSIVERKLKVVEGTGVPLVTEALEVATVAKHSGELSTDVLSNLKGTRDSSRRVRRRFPFKSITFFLFVLVPTLLAGVYLGYVASYRYTSEFRVVVRAVEKNKGDFPALLGLAGVSQANNDSQSVVQYLQSHEPVNALDESIKIKSFFENANIDLWSRLPEDASSEEILKYWRGMVDAYYEKTTGTVVVRTTAFKPKDALKIAETSLKLSENLVNQMSGRVRDDTLSFAGKEVSVAEQRLKNVNEKLRKLRNQQNMLDPRKSAEADLALMARLSTEITELNATLAQQLRLLNNNAPTVRTTRGRIAALNAELKKINAKVTTSEGNAQTLSTVIGAFEQLESERLFSEKAYQSSLASLETARMDANRQQIYLSTIVRPSLPEDPSFPRPIYHTALVFFAAFLAWVTILLLKNAVMDHS